MRAFRTFWRTNWILLAIGLGLSLVIVALTSLTRLITNRVNLFEGMIAYAANAEGGYYNLYTFDLTTQQPTRLTQSVANDTHPSWLPNEFIIALQTDRSQQTQDVYIVSSNGNTAPLINLEAFNESDPHFASDGVQVTYVGDERGQADIFSMNRDMTALRMVADSGGQDADPSWSPDRQQIAFTGTSNGITRLYAVTLATGEVRALTDGNAIDQQPTWSPNGQQIAFSSNRTPDGRFAIHILTLNNGQIRPLLSEGVGNEYEPSWSAEGRRIVFSSDRTGNRDLFMVDVRRRQLYQLTATPFEEIQPAWR
ncbi:MAG: TolB family protein [Phototrophicaceae bacterium]